MGDGARKMIKILWLILIAPIFWLVYGIASNSTEICLYALGMLNMELVLMCFSWFVDDKND